MRSVLTILGLVLLTTTALAQDIDAKAVTGFYRGQAVESCAYAIRHDNEESIKIELKSTSFILNQSISFPKKDLKLIALGGYEASVAYGSPDERRVETSLSYKNGKIILKKSTESLEHGLGQTVMTLDISKDFKIISAATVQIVDGSKEQVLAQMQCQF